MEPPPLSISNTSLAATFCILFFFYALFQISKRFYSHRKRQPPEADGGWPLIGHLHLLAGPEPAHKILANMADVHGPIFTLRMGIYKALVVSNWEIARECFTTHDKTFANRPKLRALKLLGYDYALFGFSPYGQYWRQVRKIVMQELLTNQPLELLQHIRKFEVRKSIRELYDSCGGDVGVDMKQWFGNITLNTVFRMVVGKRFLNVFESVDENERYRKTMRDFFKFSGMFVASDAFPFLKWFDLGGHEKAMKKVAKELDEVLDKWLKEHRQRRQSGEIKTENDFMDVMLSIVEDDTETWSYNADTVIKATCLALILAGADTTTITMIWALSLLVNNQEALKKAQNEIEEQVGRERQVEESDVKNLIYLQAIVKETLRLYPAAPLSAPHESMEDCTVSGYHIPAGTRLLVNLQKLQRDPLAWEDPCEFRPERFLSKGNDFEVRGQTPQFIPFGNGRRICPGISFALQLMHLTLANLIHGFEIQTPSNEPVDMEESIGLTSVKVTPLEVLLTPRLHPQVYDSKLDEK